MSKIGQGERAHGPDKGFFLYDLDVDLYTWFRVNAHHLLNNTLWVRLSQMVPREENNVLRKK